VKVEVNRVVGKTRFSAGWISSCESYHEAETIRHFIWCRLIVMLPKEVTMGHAIQG